MSLPFEKSLYSSFGDREVHVCQLQIQYRIAPILSKFPSEIFNKGNVKVCINIFDHELDFLIFKDRIKNPASG